MLKKGVTVKRRGKKALRRIVQRSKPAKRQRVEYESSKQRPRKGKQRAPHQVIFLEGDHSSAGGAQPFLEVSHKYETTSHPASLEAIHIATQSGTADLSKSHGEFPSCELPFSYNETKLVLMVRDPYWAFSYWDLSEATWSRIQSLYRERGSELRSILRVYDVTNLKWNGLNAHSSFDLEVLIEARNWYIQLGRSNREWVVDLGLLDLNGQFFVIARSNRIRTPRDGPSEVIDEAWMSKDFDEIYSLSGGLGIGSSEQKSAKRKGKHLFEQGASSAGVSGFRSP